MVLGCYYLTSNNIKNLYGTNHYFVCPEDVLLAYSNKQIDLHALVWVQEANSLENLKYTQTTPGRILFNKTIRKSLNLI
jgi:DNA-directed RNA polymerase subunit beta'